MPYLNIVQSKAHASILAKTHTHTWHFADRSLTQPALPISTSLHVPCNESSSGCNGLLLRSRLPCSLRSGGRLYTRSGGRLYTWNEDQLHGLHLFLVLLCIVYTNHIYICFLFASATLRNREELEEMLLLSGSQKIMTQVCVRWSIDSRLVHVFTVQMFLARYIFKDSHGYILPFSWLPFTFLLVTVLTLPLRRYNLGDASLHLLVEVYV